MWPTSGQGFKKSETRADLLANIGQDHAWSDGDATTIDSH